MFPDVFINWREGFQRGTKESAFLLFTRCGSFVGKTALNARSRDKPRIKLARELVNVKISVGLRSGSSVWRERVAFVIQAFSKRHHRQGPQTEQILPQVAANATLEVKSARHSLTQEQSLWFRLGSQPEICQDPCKPHLKSCQLLNEVHAHKNGCCKSEATTMAAWNQNHNIAKSFVALSTQLGNEKSGLSENHHKKILPTWQGSVTLLKPEVYTSVKLNTFGNYSDSLPERYAANTDRSRCYLLSRKQTQHPYVCIQSTRMVTNEAQLLQTFLLNRKCISGP